jgi:hypothetical protein
MGKVKQLVVRKTDKLPSSDLRGNHQNPGTSKEPYPSESEFTTPQNTVLPPGKRNTTYSPDQALYLQRTVGNRETQKRLKAAKEKSPTASGIRRTAKGTVQRAVGFEFEFGTWKTEHDDEERSPLAKGERIVKGEGYKIEGEDGQNGSAIEIVTKPYTGVEEAVTSINQANTTLSEMHAEGEGTEVSATDWQGAENVLIIPGTPKGKMQASPAIALDKLTNLYAKQAEIGGGNANLGTTVKNRLGGLKDSHLNGNDASPELVGLVTLIIDYLEQGSGSGQLSYPKSAYKLMARTSFNKMFELVPEYAYFSNPQNIDKWVELVLTIAQSLFGKETYQEENLVQVPATKRVKKKGLKGLFGKKEDRAYTKWVSTQVTKSRTKTIDEMGDERVIGQSLNDMEPIEEGGEKGNYNLNLTRNDWLRNMATEDLLSKENDKRFEGMGAYGGAMDVEELDQVDDPVEDLEPEVEQATIHAVDDLNLDEMATQPENPKQNIEDNQDGGNQKQPRKAPLFEFRGMRDMFGIDQDISLEGWETKVRDIFTIVDEVNEGSFKAGGKPVVPPDKTNEDLWTRKD